MSIKTRFEQTQEEVRDWCRQVGRDPASVTLIAVSKTVGIEGVKEAALGGALNFGENRPDSLVPKYEACPQLNWHFIGNIQSRRIPEIVQCSCLIHSVFEQRHLDKIERVANELGKSQEVLIEVNVSGEASKSGLEPSVAENFILSNIESYGERIRGLMTMAPRGDEKLIRMTFERLFQLREKIASQLDPLYKSSFSELSMGMSEDWKWAIAEGATMVRIGRAIFSDSFIE